MKKRDLTKLVLTGMAAGSLIASQNVGANEENPQVEGNLLAHGCPGKSGCSGQRPPQYSSNPYQTHYVDLENQDGQNGNPSGQDQVPPQGNQPYYYRNNPTAQPDQTQRYNSQNRYLASIDEDQDSDEDELLALDDDEDDANLFASDEDESQSDEDHELFFADDTDATEDSDIIA